MQQSRLEICKAKQMINQVRQYDSGVVTIFGRKVPSTNFRGLGLQQKIIRSSQRIFNKHHLKKKGTEPPTITLLTGCNRSGHPPGKPKDLLPIIVQFKTFSGLESHRFVRFFCKKQCSVSTLLLSLLGKCNVYRTEEGAEASILFVLEKVKCKRELIFCKEMFFGFFARNSSKGIQSNVKIKIANGR